MPRYTIDCAVTSIQFCRTAGLTERETRNWLDYGLLDVGVIGRDGGGHQRQFSPDQAERARLIKTLQTRARN